MSLARLLLAALTLGACATTTTLPTEGLQHGISGRIHVLIGPPRRVEEACRGMGIGEGRTGRVLGCYLQAGDSHWLWAGEDLDLADTLAHEVRHSHDGAFHGAAVRVIPRVWPPGKEKR